MRPSLKNWRKTFKFKIVAITLREDLSVWRNNWTAIAYQDGKIFRDRKYEVEIVDRVGAGDSFTAGFLYGWLKEKDVEKGVQYGNAFAALETYFARRFQLEHSGGRWRTQLKRGRAEDIKVDCKSF